MLATDRAYIQAYGSLPIPHTTALSRPHRAGGIFGKRGLAFRPLCETLSHRNPIKSVLV